LSVGGKWWKKKDTEGERTERQKVKKNTEIMRERDES
jgi:hypothetical protein